MELLPPARAASTVFHSSPFTFPNNRQSGTVDDEMHAGTRGDTRTLDVEVLATPGECRVIRGGEIETEHPEDRGQKAFGLAEWEVKTRRSVSAASIAAAEYCNCPPRLPTPARSHVAIASGVSQTVTSPR